MTLLHAQQYDESRDRHRGGIIISAIIAGLFLVWVGFHLRNYPERHAANNFFSALERSDLETAFVVWNNDADWKQHPDKFSKYSYAVFGQDWGPSGEGGIMKSYAIAGLYCGVRGI